jgi:hypothetical protein
LVELRGAAHGLMVEAPNAFNAAVLDFLDQTTDATGISLDEVVESA